MACGRLCSTIARPVVPFLFLPIEILFSFLFSFCTSFRPTYIPVLRQRTRPSSDLDPYNSGGRGGAINVSQGRISTAKKTSTTPTFLFKNKSSALNLNFIYFLRKWANPLSRGIDCCIWVALRGGRWVSFVFAPSKLGLRGEDFLFWRRG